MWQRIAFNRRQMLAMLTGGASTFSSPGRAVETKRLGILWPYAESDPDWQKRFSYLKDGLGQLGWQEASNYSVEHRWTGGDAGQMDAMAKELVARAPDVIHTTSTPCTRALHHASRTVPVVFVQLSDPVGDGFVASLAEPGGNITGFTQFEPSAAGKWLEYLKAAAPQLSRVVIAFNPTTSPYSVFLATINEAAPRLGITLSEQRWTATGHITSAIAEIAMDGRSGLLCIPDSFTTVNRKLIIEACERFLVPAMYNSTVVARDGGLLSYGADVYELCRQSASYLHRIFRGERPSLLPVQQPTKFEFVVNLRAAKAIGLALPPLMISTADEVIE